MNNKILVMTMVLAAFGYASAADAEAAAQSATAAAQPAATSGALAKAMGEIANIISEPAKMTEVMKTLSPAEQKQFVAAVNEAIATSPASNEEKAAKYVNVTHAALKGASKGNLATIIAEVVATVKVDALPVVCESMAQNSINRAADPNVTYTESQFTAIATELMNKINDRTAEVDNSLPRSALAITMLLGASNNPTEELTTALVNTLPAKDRETVEKEWLPAATGSEGGEKSYEPILAAANADVMSNSEVVLTIAGPQQFDALLSDVPNIDSTAAALAYGDNSLTAATTSMANPQATQSTLKNDVAAQDRVAQPAGGDADPTYGPTEEPGPYQGQTL